MINAILLMGGDSLRIKENKDDNLLKQYYLLNNKESFLYPLFSLLLIKEIDNIILVTKSTHLEDTKKIVLSNFEFIKENILNPLNIIKDLNTSIHYVTGGCSRQESVFKGLNYIKHNLSNNDNDKVIIHDAARVLLNPNIILDSLNLIKTNKYKATTTYLDSSDSLILTSKNKDELNLTTYLNRDNIKRILTPQCFIFKDLYEAHIKSNELFLDDVSLLLSTNNYKVGFIKGDIFDFKITTTDDLRLIERIIDNSTISNLVSSLKNK